MGGENEVMVDMTKPHTLHQLYPRYVGFLSLLFLLGNVGLQVFSHVGLSAVIKSSIDPNAGEGSTPTGKDACVNDSDFMAYWNTSGQTDYADNLQNCGPYIVISADMDGFVQCLRKANFNGSDECAECFSLPVDCTGSNCLKECFPDKDVPECLQCRAENQCDEKFVQCTGVDVPANARRLLQSSESDTLELYVVYNISFISSVRDAANGGAWAITVVIVLFSGIWPYLKNVVMLISWFVPMTAATRSTVLKNLTRLAKWSLVDVFAIVIIIAGVRIDKIVQGGTRLVVVAESRVAIATFCVAAIWDLVQGEWMRFMHLEALEKFKAATEKDASVAASRSISALESASPSSTVTSVVTFKNGADSKVACSRFGRLVTPMFMFVQLALFLAGIAVICITFNIEGLLASQEGPNEYAYSAATITKAMISPDALKYNDSVPGTVFLALMYVLCAIVIPLFEYLSVLILSLVPWKRLCCGKVQSLRKFFVAVDILGGFASLDVFLLAFVVVTAEWDRLIEKAVGSQAQNMKACTGETVCLAMSSDLGVGIFLMLAAAVLGWVMELFFTYAFAEMFHPEEHAAVGKAVLACLVGKTCFGTEATSLERKSGSAQRDEESFEFKDKLAESGTH